MVAHIMLRMGFDRAVWKASSVRFPVLRSSRSIILACNGMGGTRATVEVWYMAPTFAF